MSCRATRAVPRLSVPLALCVLALGMFAPLALAAGGAKILRTGHPGEPDSLDPQVGIAAPGVVVATDLFEGLYTLDRNGRPVLGAAQSVRTLQDAAGPVLEFTLLPNLRWSDGTPLTAADFEYSFKRLADPATAGTLLASNVSLFRNGEAVLAGRAPPSALGVRAVDARRLRIELTRNVAWLPSVLAFPAFAPVPRHVIEKHGRNWSRPGIHVSNGPFMLTRWQPNNLVEVARNPRFHDAANVRLDGVQYLPITDQNSAFRLFKDGQLDTITNFPPGQLDFIRSNMKSELHLAPSLGVTMYFFNLRRPLFRDVRVRKALALAIDRDMLTTRIVRTGDQPAYGLIPPRFPNYLPSITPRPATQAQRLAEARRLLAEAGYSAAKPLQFELLYHTSDEHRSVAVAAAAMWQAIGVRATLRNAERQVVEVATRNGEFDVVRAALFTAYADPNGLFLFFRSGSSANGSGYANPAFDAAVERAEQEVTPGPRRAAAQRQAEQLLVDDQAFLPLYFSVSRRLVSKRVAGWSDDNLTSLRPSRYLGVTP